MAAKRVLFIGIDPTLVDFSPSGGRNAEQVRAAAKLCFNTNPGDTVEAVQRWV